MKTALRPRKNPQRGIHSSPNCPVKPYPRNIMSVTEMDASHSTVGVRLVFILDAFSLTSLNGAATRSGLLNN